MNGQKASNRRLRPLTWVLGLIALAVLAGCVQLSQDVSLSARPMARGALGPPVAILGVDFDPPVEQLRGLPPQGITLLVAVENRTAKPRRGVRVRAQLLVGSTVFMEREGIIPELPPGEVKVYAFPRLRRLPLREVYRLVIEVRDPAGVQVLDRREYTLRVAGR